MVALTFLFIYLFFSPFLLPFRHAGSGEKRGLGPPCARAEGTGAKMEIEGGMKGVKGGEEGEDALRLDTAYPPLALCVLWERQEGMEGGKMGGKRNIWVRTARGKDARGVRGKIFPSFFADPPPSPQSRFDFSHRSSQPPRMQMTFIMQMHANQV